MKLPEQITAKNAGLTIGALILIVLVFPLSNLLDSNQEKRFKGIKEPQTEAFKPVSKIFKNKCMDCHSKYTHFPLYAKLPIASGMITQDIKQARHEIDFEEAFYNSPPTEVDLAKLEHAVRKDKMPPLRYLLMHWDADLSEKNKSTLLTWIETERERIKKTQTAISSEPIPPVPLTVSLSPEKIGLGYQLFHDPRFSKDNAVSCASCHGLTRGGTDRRTVSTGVEGKQGKINAPTVFNAVHNFKQFWSGKAETLERAVEYHVHDPLVMESNWKEIVSKLEMDELYVEQFKSVYKSDIQAKHIMNALAEFQKSLITPNSRFDKYLRGDWNALNEEEKQGYKLFKQNECTRCHSGVNLGGQSFQKLGEKKSYFEIRGREETQADLGRYNVTEDDIDKYYFKVPTLRNITQTDPYFHDGSTRDLQEVVQIMAESQTGEKLPDKDAELIVKFLNTLTGEYQGKVVQ